MFSLGPPIKGALNWAPRDASLSDSNFFFHFSSLNLIPVFFESGKRLKKKTFSSPGFWEVFSSVPGNIKIAKY